MGEEMHTLNNKNKKLLAEKEFTLDKLKNQFEHVSVLTKSEKTEGMKTVYNLEQQINSLVN